MKYSKVVFFVFFAHLIFFYFFSKNFSLEKKEKIKEKTVEIEPEKKPVVKKLSKLISKPKPKPLVKKVVRPRKINISKKEPSSVEILKNEIFQTRFIYELQNFLFFPEYGEVKMKITITPNGKISKVIIISSKSKKNEEYLKNRLPTLSFPWLNQFITKNREITVSFLNEE